MTHYTFAKIIGLTAVFVGIYAIVRQLPNQTCGFLHYEMNVIDEKGLEFCQTDAGVFFDIEAMPFPVQVEIIQADMPIRFALKHPSGSRFLPQDMAKSHTELVHALWVHESLDDYQHVHPTPNGLTGEWVCSFEPRYAGRYHGYFQFVHAKTKRHVLADYETSCTQPVPSTQHSFPGRLELRHEPLQIGTPCKITIDIYPDTPGELDILMNAYGHVVIFHETKKGLAHVHPLPTSYTQPDQSRLAFLFQPSLAGQHRLWFQFKWQGAQYYWPFDLYVPSA